MSWFRRCKHDWETVSEATLPSVMDRHLAHTRELASQPGVASFDSGPANYQGDTLKTVHVVILKCNGMRRPQEVCDGESMTRLERASALADAWEAANPNARTSPRTMLEMVAHLYTDEEYPLEQAAQLCDGLLAVVRAMKEAI